MSFVSRFPQYLLVDEIIPLGWCMVDILDARDVDWGRDGGLVDGHGGCTERRGELEGISSFPLAYMPCPRFRVWFDTWPCTILPKLPTEAQTPITAPSIT